MEVNYGVCSCLFVHFSLMIQVFGVGIKLDRIIEILEDKNYGYDD